jgi:hypothetical protein
MVRDYVFRSIQFAPLFALYLAACSSSPAPAPPSETAWVDQVRASPAEQARMKAYADAAYDERDVRTSFQSGDHKVDCIEFLKQPACKLNPQACTNVTPPGPTQEPRAFGAPPETHSPPPVQVAPVGPSCPNGTVPFTRPRIEDMRRFPTLEAYLGRGGKVAPPHP